MQPLIRGMVDSFWVRAADCSDPIRAGSRFRQRPVPERLRPLLHHEAHLADGDLARRELLAERFDHGCGRLFGCAVAQRQVRCPLFLAVVSGGTRTGDSVGRGTRRRVDGGQRRW
jgi:hypothetical protein